MKKYILLFLYTAVFPLFIFGETPTKPQSDPNQKIEKLSSDTQDLNTPTKLCRDCDFCSYFEFDIGYRRDSIKDSLELISTWYDITGARTQKTNFAQLNFKGGIKFLKHLFVNGSIGYGILGSSKESEESFLTGTSILVNEYTKTFNSGHAFDWLVGGGFFLNLYKNRVALLPEIGYNSKKYLVKNSLDLKITSPYVGGKLYFAPGANIGICIFGSYFFSPTRKETGYLHLVSSSDSFKTHEMKTSSGIPAYIVGADLSYLITRHFSVSFNWERFAASTKTKKFDFGSGITGNQTLNHWISNQYTVGARYTF